MFCLYYLAPRAFDSHFLFFLALLYYHDSFSPHYFLASFTAAGFFLLYFRSASQPILGACFRRHPSLRLHLIAWYRRLGHAQSHVACITDSAAVTIHSFIHSLTPPRLHNLRAGKPSRIAHHIRAFRAFAQSPRITNTKRKKETASQHLSALHRLATHFEALWRLHT